MKKLSDSQPFDTGSFRQTMGCFVTGIAVVTAMNDQRQPVGLTINSLTSVSLDPPLLLFCLDKKASLYPVFAKADRFAFNFLAQSQEDVSRYFSSAHAAKPENLWDPQQQDCPILHGSLGWVLCRPFAAHPGGDHTIFVGEVVDFHKRSASEAPLVYFHGRYRTLADLDNVTSGARK